MIWHGFGTSPRKVRSGGALLCAVVLCATAARCAEAELQPPVGKTVVQTQFGPVSGLLDGGVHVFKGIPFAKPPVGPRRWCPPEDPAPWKDVLECEEYSAICPQRDLGLKSRFALGPRQEMSEDCLYLNVFTRQPTQGANLPVMVWIHGGGLSFGAASAPSTDGVQLATRDVVVVTFNYRLGMFGFLAHKNLTDVSQTGSSGNYGLLDQIHALRWVSNNIDQFGGNPDNVTIFGESAGGVSVCALMSTPLEDVTFHRAICHSAGAIGHLRPLKDAPPGCKSGEDLGVEFAELLGVPDGNLDQMRAKTWEQVLEADTQLGGDAQQGIDAGGGVWKYLMVDGHVLTESPAEVFQRGGQKDVPLMIGSNRDEGTLFNYPPWRCPWTKYWSIWRQMPVHLRGEFRDVYPAWDWRSAAQAVTQWVGDEIPCATRLAVRAHAAQGYDTYQYEFARVPRWAERAWLGAYHSAEIPYVFGNSPTWPRFAGFDPVDWKLSEKMQWYWVSFAETGNPNESSNPNAPNLPDWPEHTTADDRYLVLDLTIGTGEKLRQAQCDFRKQVPRTCHALPQPAPCPLSRVTPHCGGCKRLAKLRGRDGPVLGAVRSRCRLFNVARRRAR